MAHETLKNLITNNIKTNGQNAITAQILQNVLIAMVDEYPDISGYATRTWVQQQDYAPKDWVENKNYATQDWANQKFNNYLPLTGGTMAGPITYGDDTDGKYEFFSQGLIFSKGVNRYAVGVSLGLDEGLPYIHFFTRGGQLIGTEITHDNVTSDAFIKRNGTSAQFLKADGSVDGNTYLPLTGGTLTGNLVFSYDKGIYFGTDNKVKITRNSSKLLIVDEAGNDIIIGDYDNTAYTSIINDLQGCPSNSAYILGNPTWFILNDGTAQFKTVKSGSFIKNNGTSDEVLCADGSTKTLPELKAALNAI